VSVVFDHVFICTEPGAPAAEWLRHIGLAEGKPNRHAGQGTACRRFFFRNAMLELLWVEDAEEAKSDQTRRTRLWERWSAAGRGASPFGIIVRPTSQRDDVCPFPSWEYRPAAMPDLVLQIAAGTMLEEPMWCYMKGGRAPAEAPPESRQVLVHPAGFREITGVRILGPGLEGAAVTRAMANMGVIAVESAEEHLLVLQFDNGGEGCHADMRPRLPMVLRW